MSQLTKRRLSREHMDDPDVGRDDQAQALRFIRMVNRRLGGSSTVITELEKWSINWKPNQVINILDIGTGSADIPVAIANWAAANNHRVHITAVDLHPVTLELAREYIGMRENIELVQADALRLMERFQAGQFDYVHAGMFLHHLNDVEVMTVLRIMDRLASRALIWNDLVRSWIGKLGVRVLTLAAPPLVKHDAIVSIDAGYTRREALDLAHRAGLVKVHYRQHLAARFTLTAVKS
jgi:hypothetical protein